MARFTLIVLLAAALASLTHADPQVSLQDDYPIHTSDSWTYSNCGQLKTNYTSGTI